MHGGDSAHWVIAYMGGCMGMHGSACESLLASWMATEPTSIPAYDETVSFKGKKPEIEIFCMG